jgi:hypothetical protein
MQHHNHLSTPSSELDAAPAKWSVRHRWIFVSSLALGGVLAFFVWTLPSLLLLRGTIHLSFEAVLLAIFVALTPVIYVVGGLLLMFFAWQVGDEYQWWGLSSRIHFALPRHEPGKGKEMQQTSAFAAQPLKQVSQPVSHTSDVLKSDETAVVQPSAPKKEIVRRPRTVAATTLAERRRKKFYGSRQYMGKVQHTDEAAEQLSQLPVQISHENGMTPRVIEESVSTSGAEEPVAVDDENAALLAGVLKIASPGGSVGPSTPAVPIVNETLLVPSDEEHEEASRLMRPVAISLLKEVTIIVQNGQGIKRTVELNRQSKETRRYVQRELLIRLASQKGLPVKREKLIEDVFAYGLPQDRYDMTKLTRQFNKMTQFLREDVNREASQLGLPELLVTQWDQKTDTWRLSLDDCCVLDLVEVERAYNVLKEATGDEILQPHIQEACQALLDAYRGDFLENYIEAYINEGGSDDWVDHWARDLYTLYRDMYFDALWYRAEYWRFMADLTAGSTDAERTLQNNWYETAAKLYGQYALHVPTKFNDHSAMLFDVKIKQRISPGERAMRSCLDCYTATGNTQAADKTYREFAGRLSDLTMGKWKPRADTEEAIKNARAQTKAHRMRLGLRPHEVPQEEVSVE